MNILHKKKIASSLFVLIILAAYTNISYAKTSLRINPTKVNFRNVEAEDFETGYIEEIVAQTLQIGCNENTWKILIKTNDNHMGIVGSYSKSIDDFQWRAQGQYATQTFYESIENYDREVAEGSQGSRIEVYMDYRILLAWPKDVSGDYGLTVTYTLVTQ